MRHATTTALVAIGVVAIGVLAVNALRGGSAAADKTPASTTSPGAQSSTSETSTSAPVAAAPTDPSASTIDSPRPVTPFIPTRAVDPGMVLSGEHVVTSEEVYGTTEATNGEAADK